MAIAWREPEKSMMLSECGRWSIAKVPVFPTGARYELHRLDEEHNGIRGWMRWIMTGKTAAECKAAAEAWR